MAIAAAVLSFSSLSGLAGMAGVTGRAGWFRLAWLLPIAVDAYAVTATRVWLRSGVNARTRAYARRNSVGAIGLSVAGNATFHGLSAAGVRTLTGAGAGWLLVVAVSAVPPVMLGLVGHLHALICAEHNADAGPAPAPAIAEQAPAPALPAPAIATSPDRGQTGTVPADSRPAKAGRSRSTGRRTSTGNGPTSTGKTAGAEALMRAHWAAERAAGRTPTGAELDRVAGTHDYGRKVRRSLLAEGTPPTHPDPAGQPVEETATAADAA